MTDFNVAIFARYRDPGTGAVTEITLRRTQVEAPDREGAKVSGIGLARSVTMAELLDDPDTCWAVTVFRDSDQSELPRRASRPEEAASLSYSEFQAIRAGTHADPRYH